MPGTVERLALAPDIGGNNSLIRPAPGWVDARALTAGGSAETFAVPAGADAVIFSANGVFYANPVTTATVPGDTADGTASELSPTAWQLRPINGTVPSNISVISPTGGATIVTAAWYKLAK